MTGNVSIKASGPSPRDVDVRVDGVKMRGLSKVEIVAEANQATRVLLHVYPAEIDVTGIGDVAVRHAATGSDIELGPRFDSLGRQRWAEAEEAIAANAEHLARINSRIGTLAYFRDEPPPGGPAEGEPWEPGKNFAYDQWVLNTQSMHDGVKHNSAYLFAKNAVGQYEANEALVEQNGHVATVTFQSRAAANEFLAKWIATQRAIDPRDPNAPNDFTPP